MSWTQPLCPTCWTRENPGRAPIRVKPAEREACCLCGTPTTDGIYTRKDPSTVPFPRVREDS
jgi:hypothetical protein